MYIHVSKYIYLSILPLECLYCSPLIRGDTVRYSLRATFLGYHSYPGIPCR